MNYAKLLLLGLVMLVAALGANWGHDLAYRVHAFLILAVAGGLFIWQLPARTNLCRRRPDRTSIPTALSARA